MIGSIITSIYNGGASGLLYAWYESAITWSRLHSPLRQTAADNVFLHPRIVDNFFFLFVALSMAELTSAMPTSAGVYHWSAALAGPRFAKPIGFLTGYFNVLGYTLGLASLYSVAGLEITGLYQLWHPTYRSQQWQVFVVFVVLTWSTASFVQFGNKILPLYTKVGRVSCLSIKFIGAKAD